MKDKQFDCVEMKRCGSEKIYEQVKSLSLQEELDYWQQRTQKLKLLKNQRSLQPQK